MQRRPMLLVGLSLILFTGYSSARYILVDIGDEIGTSNLRVGEDKGVTYFEATNGKLCSETGDIAIEDSTTCKEAAEELGYKFMTTEDYANWPKGCYLYYNRHLVRDAVWFNRHTHGKQLPNTRNICKGFVKDLYMATKNKYCEFHNEVMTSEGLEEAKRECSNDPTCSRFYYDCGTKGYYKCTASSDLSSSGCGSIVYTKESQPIFPRQTIRDPGYPNCGEGWYDVQGQGVCNDYCRWVGDCGCRESCSYWSCALAGSPNHYTQPGQYDEQTTQLRNCTDCITITVGSSEAQTKTVTNYGEYKCPTIVNKDNWLGGYGYSDTFSVEQRETHIVVTRRDSYGGWGMNLEFRCCR